MGDLAEEAVEVEGQAEDGRVPEAFPGSRILFRTETAAWS